MTVEIASDVQKRIDGLVVSTWAFSALVTAIEVGLVGTLDSPGNAAEAAAPGLHEFRQASQPEDILARLRSAHLQSRAMVDDARRGELRSGWTHTDPEILQAQGWTGRALVHTLAAQVYPLLPGLQERLEGPGGTFLDIGMGVGIISIEMCRIYPRLRVVGLEPGRVQAEEARRNIAEAGFQDRIEVRAQRLEDLADREAYDFVYLPQVFIPIDVVKSGLNTIREALRPGGWISMVAIDAPGDDLNATTARLLNVIWGGSPISLEEPVGLTRAAGFEMVRAGGDLGSTVKGVVGRRPPQDR